MSTFDLLRFERLQQSLFPPSLKNTACVLWIGKNYRLQDIQLSKNPSTFQSTLAATHGNRKTLESLLRVFRAPRSRLYLVENTGLEPVTSWLQTRRSPS